MKLTELHRIGLTDGEIKVYSALLDLGECTKTALARRSGIAPSNIYDVTGRLAEKGMISMIEKGGVTHFAPANPKRIKDYLEDKSREVEAEKAFVDKMMPTLMAQFAESKEKVNVESFHGWKGMKNVFEDMIDECSAKDQCLVFGASIGVQDEMADRFFLKYSRLRAEKGINTKIIFNKELRKRKKRIAFFEKSPRYQVRFLDQSTPAEIMVYKNRTCMIILTKEPLVVRITGREAADSFRQYFEVMWKMGKE